MKMMMEITNENNKMWGVSMQRDFLAEMNALLNHEKDEIIVEKTEFLDFQKVWVNYNHRKEIVGFAQRNGRVIYRASESGIV